MHSGKEAGEISQRQHYEVEWTVKDILSYTVEDEYCRSPTFSVPGSKWYLLLYPNGQKDKNSTGWLSLYLARGDDSSLQKNVTFQFGVKTASGTVEKLLSEYKYDFINNSIGNGVPKLMMKSKLLERKLELTPTGDLTITCSMSVNDGFECTSRLNELSDNFQNMFLSSVGCDATLKVKNEEFSVHRSVLSSRSPVFEAMFEVDMKEKNTGTVEIVDLHPKAFRDFLMYIYSGKFENSSEEISELYRIAHKYCAEELKSACLLSIKNNLSVDNVLEASILGHEFEEIQLKNESQAFFSEHFAKVVLTDKWYSLLESNSTLANEMLKKMAENAEIKIKNDSP